MKRTLALIAYAFFLWPCSTMAQDEEANIAGFRFLNYTDELPKNFLESRSAVLVSVPSDHKATSERGNWRGFATTMHEEFRKMGIDAVAYLYIDDVMAGPDATEAFSGFLTSRQIANLIIISKVTIKIAGRESERVVVAVTPFNGKETFMTHGQPAWKDQDKDAEKVLKNLGKAVYRSKQQQKNFLITEKPEFFTDAVIIKNRRFPSFAVDLKVDKLAVPMFTEVEIPADRPGGIVNNNLEKEIQRYNAKVAAANTALKDDLATYPFKYELVTFDGDEKKLYNQGFQYVLLNLHTAGHSIMQMLDFEGEDEDEYVTVKNKGGKSLLRSIPAQAPVYKFYVKHLITGDVYLGTRWDADETLEEALKNHLADFRQELKIR